MVESAALGLAHVHCRQVHCVASPVFPQHRPLVITEVLSDLGPSDVVDSMVLAWVGTDRN